MDILKKYKKHKKMSNLSIIAISLVVAFGVNFFIFDNSNISNKLKTNILENDKKINTGDIYLEKNGKDLILKTNKNINNITNFSLSFVYNPENITIREIIPKLNSEVIDISNTPGISTFMINYKEKSNIKAGDKILTIKLDKKENKTENLNIINSNFTDSDNNTFELSSNSISF